MEPNVIIHLDGSAEQYRGIVEELVSDSMGKIDAYLRRYEDKPDAVVRIEIHVKQNKDDSFHGKLHANVDGEVILFDREKFFNLDDLIHHAFQHMKEHLAAK